MLFYLMVAHAPLFGEEGTGRTSLLTVARMEDCNKNNYLQSF